MSMAPASVSDMLVTVKSREVQRALLAEMRGDQEAAQTSLPRQCPSGVGPRRGLRASGRFAAVFPQSTWRRLVLLARGRARAGATPV